MNSQDLSVDGCLKLYYKHLELCVIDYAKAHKYVPAMEDYLKYPKNRDTKRVRTYNMLLDRYRSAKRYIYGGDLRLCIVNFGLQLNLDYFQRKCTQMANGEIELKKETEDYEQEEIEDDDTEI